MNESTDTPIWRPSPEYIASSNLTAFMKRLSAATGRTFDSYQSLWEFSVTEYAAFWQQIWTDADIVHSAPYTEVVSGKEIWRARWFEGARLNFAENLLRYRDDRPAIVGQSEDGQVQRYTYADLFAAVAKCAAGLRALGVREGDRVAAFIPNIPEAIIAMLATTSIGAIWSSSSPDFGLKGVLDRFGQIEPKVLITADGYRYNGKEFDSLTRVEEIIGQLPAIEHIVVIPRIGAFDAGRLPQSLSWDALLDNDATGIQFAQLPFDHPVYIMYSSGTTGVPKCMVHGAGGTLLQHYKEHVLHTDLRRDDVITYFTTCGWMMWNWLVSALQIGATIYIYDGSPSYPNLGTLWKAVENEKISVFGTSPKFLSGCENTGLEPGREYDLGSLRAVLSTGSPLSIQNFEYVYSKVKSNLQLASISGGTDIVSCFMLGCPILPVYRGEIQCRGLGMKVETFNDEGQRVTGEVGELVCTAPFPSRPVFFWNDPDHRKYIGAYFDHFPGVWRHGDYIRITEHGGVVVYGRSDATLNPGGVRIGTAEIYAPVEAMDEVTDSIVIGQPFKNDVRIVLFVVLRDGLTLDDALKERIRARIRAAQTPRHVPARIIQVREVPHTINGKKVELAVTRIIQGKEVFNRDALGNPEALEQFRDLPELAD